MMINDCCVLTDFLQDSDYQEVYTLLQKHAQELSPEVKTIIALAFKKAKNISPIFKNESLMNTNLNVALT